jgi:hypothetical protein
MNVSDHFRLSTSQQAILLYLRHLGGTTTAAECIKRARGIYAYLNDLKFLDYVDWDEPLTRRTVVMLTSEGRDFLKWQFPGAPDDFDQCAQLVIPLFQGKPARFDSNYVFVLMPFVDTYDLQQIYADHIYAPLSERGFRVER